MVPLTGSAARGEAKSNWFKRPDLMIFGLRNVFCVQGGIESHVRHLAEQLARKDLDVEILIRSPYRHAGARQIGDRIKLTEIWSPRHAALETIVHSLLCVGYALVRRPRLLHIHAIGPGLMSPIARFFGLKVVVTHHGQDYHREKWGFIARAVLRAGERLAARFANEIIVVSLPLAGGLATQYDRRFEYIPNGVSTSAQANAPCVLETLGLSPAKYVLHVGRIVPEKRQIDLIEAFLKLNLPDLRLVFVGAADHESDYSRRLAALAARDPRIVLAGFQEGEALSTLYDNAALFALPSSHEGMPISALEAMSFGLPLLVSDIPANLALNLPPESYAATGTVESWVEGLRRQLNNGGGRRIIDWSPWLRPYRWDDVANRTFTLYERVWRQEKQPALPLQPGTAGRRLPGQDPFRLRRRFPRNSG